VRILVVNAGSSSLKLRVLDGDDPAAAADLPAPGDDTGVAALEEWVRDNEPVDAVGHRVVHGGTVYTGPVVIDAEVVAMLRELTDLAPLHQPKSLAGIDAMATVLPDTPSVACFDTAFHAGLPPAAATYALPEEWRRRWGVRRFGFHGLSHAYASRRAAEMVRTPVEDLRIVTCHLGAGASLAAVVGGRSVDTTMGFTPLEGLVMATRSGSVDPGLLLWLLERQALTTAELSHALDHESGLLGLAGTADMREVLARAGGGDTVARLALDVYLHRLRAAIAAMGAALGGLDALVFTGGVGERSAEIRARAAEGLGFLGVAIDPERNAGVAGDAEISATAATTRTVVVRAREDMQIAHETRRVLAATRAAQHQ
jgi:acetate kinase